MAMVKSLEERMADLERRVSAIEVKNPKKGNDSRICKKCGESEFEFVDSKPAPHFGVFGETIDTYKCRNCDLCVEVHIRN